VALIGKVGRTPSSMVSAFMNSAGVLVAPSFAA
jgi:hypothetical protein